ncbi:MAG: alpha/beta fold hydrolase, partial [Polyangiaceae bacterium]
FTESALFFGSPEQRRRVFGVVTDPAADTRRENAPALIFLNVGANHHVGPNRMYVILARQLAARGYVSLRFDVAGLGDSPLPPGSPENRLYSKDSVDDVKAAMTFLQQTRGTSRFVLTGLCSGAYLAFHTAIEDPRVVGQVLLNPQTFEWHDGDSLELSVRKGFLSTRYYAKALLDYRVWLRAARGKVNVVEVLGALRERLRARAGANLAVLGARLTGRPAPTTEVERAFHALGDRGVDSLLVFSFNDGGVDMIERHLGGGARRMRHRQNFALVIVDDADHTFTPTASQLVLYELLERHALSRFT